MVEQLCKSVMEPALEYTRVRLRRAAALISSALGLATQRTELMRQWGRYAQNFVNALIDPVAPAPISLLSMLRLNDLLSAALVSSAPSPPSAAPGTPSTTVPPGPSTSAADLPPCPPLEAHLTSLRLLLFPTFSRTMSAQIDSLRRINGSSNSSAASGVGGMLARATGAAGGGGGAVKDSVVQVIVARYCELFNAVVALSSLGTTAGAGARAGEAAGGGVGGGEAGAEALEQAEEMVFNRCAVTASPHCQPPLA